MNFLNQPRSLFSQPSSDSYLAVRVASGNKKRSYHLPCLGDDGLPDQYVIPSRDFSWDRNVRLKIMDDIYQIDDVGREVLIGLNYEETQEYFSLHERISDRIATLDSRQWTDSDEQRWLALFTKHEAAMRPFLQTSKVRN